MKDDSAKSSFFICFQLCAYSPITGTIADQSDSFRQLQLVGLYLQGKLDADWSPTTYLLAIEFPEVNAKNHGEKMKKGDLAEFSVLKYFSILYIIPPIKERREGGIPGANSA